MKYEILMQTEKMGFGEAAEDVPVLCRRLKGAMVEKKSKGVTTKQFVRFGNVMYQSLIGCEGVEILPHLDDDFWKTAPRNTMPLPVKLTYSQYWANKSDSKRACLTREILVPKTGKLEKKKISVPPNPAKHFLKMVLTVVSREVVWYDDKKAPNTVTKVTWRIDRDTPREKEIDRKSFELNGADRDVDYTRSLGYIAQQYGQDVADTFADALDGRLSESMEMVA